MLEELNEAFRNLSCSTEVFIESIKPLSKFAGVALDQGIDLDLTDIAEYITPAPMRWSSQAEFTVECNIDRELATKLFGLDSSNTTDKCTISYDYIRWVQARTHKKARINKKWRKRYGLKPVMKNVRLEDVTFEGVDH